MAVKQRRAGDHRHADGDLDDVGDVMVRVREQRTDQLPGTDPDRGAAEEIHREHAEGELGHAAASTLAGRQIERRRDRRRVERVRQPDRHDYADQPQHGRILYFPACPLPDR